MIHKIIKFYILNPNSNFGIMLLIVVFLGILELFGIGVFVPLIDKSNILINETIDLFFTTIGLSSTEINLLIFIFFIFFLKFLLTVVFNKKLSFIMNQLVYKSRLDIVKKISHVKYTKLNHYTKGELNNIITKESEKISEGYIYVLQIFLKILLSAVYLYLSAIISYKSSILAITVGILFVFLVRNLSSLSAMYSAQLLKSNELLNNIVGEFLKDIKRLMATSTSEVIVKKVGKQLRDYSFTKYKLDYYGKLGKEIPLPIGVMIIVCVMIINNLYFYEPSIAVLLSAFLLYKTFSYITNIQYAYQKLMSISASIIKIIDIPIELENNKEELSENHISSIESLEFLSASHYHDKKRVFYKANFKLLKGKKYIVLGESGSGKTTLLNKILMLLESSRGEYMVNGVNSSDISRTSFRNLVSYVPQESIFYHGSIRENITLFNDDNKILLSNVVQKACLEQVVNHNGVDSVLDASELSGGQVQRISIAREMIKKSDLIIFDEATSSLDANTNEKLMKNFKTEFDKSIFIMVTHNLGSARDYNFDQIIFIENGVLVIENSFSECYQKYETFKNMCNNQNIIL
jgi:ABC-type multidrug transport system fused ATPase/permease subunit